MENNFIFSWLLFYSQPSSKPRSLDLTIDIQSDLLLKKQFCSSITYIESCKNLNFILPNNVTGFRAIFNYFSNHKCKIMDKLKDDEQLNFIDCLTNCDNFSMKHHISVIKCYMKAYVCDLAPLVRIKRSFLTMEVASNIEQDDETFRNIQKHLLVWLNSSATKGLMMLLQKSIKNLNKYTVEKCVSGCGLSSQLVYSMVFYAPTKMIPYTIPLPDVNTVINNEPCNKKLSVSHSEILLKAFSDICDDQDAFPIHPDKLCSVSMDNVPVTLIIALVFHWIFGNPLKNLESVLKLSSSDSLKNPGKTQNRPTNIFINSNSLKLEEVKPTKTFFLSTVSGAKGDGLHQLFSPGKTNNVKNLLENTHNNNKSNNDGGDTSPEIFLTPNALEEELPIKFFSQTLPNYKSSTQKPILINSNKTMLVKSETQEPIAISLKNEFQKKQQQKMNSSKSKVTMVSANETTWLAQKNKNDVAHIPLTPKKTNKSLSSPTQVDSQNLTKGQLNELQIQLGLQRQKIQNNKKKTAQKTERNIEDSKQKAFFQVLKTNLTRRNSLESSNSSTPQIKNSPDKRLSLFIGDERSNIELFQQINSIEDHTNSDSLINKNSPIDISKCVSLEEKIIENDEYEENIKNNELPHSLQESDLAVSGVQILHDQTGELSVDNDNSQSSSRFPTRLNYIAEVSLLEEASASRKTSSTSISSLSSISTKSADKLPINQEEYYKSIDILNKSLTSLQQEIRILSQQQQSWNKQMRPELPKDVSVDTTTSIEINNHISDNQSVPETPTNHGTSLTEITDLTKPKENNLKSPTEYVESDNMVTSDQHIITSFKSLDPLQSETKLFIEETDLPKENKFQHSISLCETDKLNIDPPDLIKYNSTEIHYYNIETPTNQQFKYIGDKSDLNSNIVENNNISVINSFTNSSTDEDIGDMTSSTDSSIISNIQPIAFVCGSDQKTEEARIKKAEMLAQREEKRKIKMELLKQKRDQDRENRLSATIDELMEREVKKKQEKEKRDSLLQKYLDRKKSETMPASVNNSNAFEKRSASAANTPVKLRVNSKTPRPVGDTGKQDSVGNLLLATSQRNTWFSSMRIPNKNTSVSTSKLHDNLIMDSNKFGVPLPPQEYNGPKLFGKRKVKTNRSVIVNAISHCCLAGSVNEALKESVLKELAEAEGTHFMILFRDARCQYRAVYSFNLVSDELNLICGSGPKKISHEMVEKFYKYNSGAKQFNIIISTKHLSPAVDGICIQAIYWNPRPGSQILPNAVSNININQPKSKKLQKNTSITN